MIETINGLHVKLLGDPHLGKAFLHGTPLHRRGDREKMQWADFEKSLMEVDFVDVHVCMGDLFDKWTVPYTVIFRAAELYKKAARANPGRTYVIIQGNHDASRDLERVSAFRLFSEIVALERNIKVVKDEPYWIHSANACLVFMPWDAVHNAAEMVEKHLQFFQSQFPVDAVFGHWDVVAFGPGTDNYIPAARFKELGVKRAITGHDHNKRDMVVDGLPVKITGSMQPYSFGEDQTGELYITVSLAELEQTRDPEFFKNRCVRVMLAVGEAITKPVDCLQLKVHRIGDDSFDDETQLNVEFEGFDFDKLAGEVFDELKVDPLFRVKALERYDAERAKQ